MFDVNLPFGSTYEKETFEDDIKRFHWWNERKEWRVAPLKGFLTSPKVGGVSRRIPVICPVDTLVYFSIAQEVESIAVRLKVDNTYGGFSMGGKRHKAEESQAKQYVADFEVYQGSSPINTEIASYEWNRYWRRAQVLYHQMSYSDEILCYDLANFYNRIDIRSLLNLLSNEGASHSTISLLESILFDWKNDKSRCVQCLPMDAIGDASRLLANIYISSVDKLISEFCLSNQYEYLRYADDALIKIPKGKSSLVMNQVSEWFHDIGLEVNALKVKTKSKPEFGACWKFETLERFANENPKNKESAIRSLCECWYDERFEKRDTAARIAITMLDKMPCSLNDEKRWISEQMLGDKQNINLHSASTLMKCINFSCNKEDTLHQVVATLQNQEFSKPKMDFIEKLLESEFSDKIELANKLVPVDGFTNLVCTAAINKYAA
jgi:hypothetical protein